MKNRIKVIGKIVCSVLAWITIFSTFIWAAQDKIVAIVNSDIITQSDADEFMQVVRMQLAAQMPEDQVERELAEADGDVIDRLIDDKIILQEARKQGVQPDKAYIQANLDELLANFEPAGRRAMNPVSSAARQDWW